jgi:hypothetical protein
MSIRQAPFTEGSRTGVGGLLATLLQRTRPDRLDRCRFMSSPTCGANRSPCGSVSTHLRAHSVARNLWQLSCLRPALPSPRYHSSAASAAIAQRRRGGVRPPAILTCLSEPSRGLVVALSGCWSCSRGPFRYSLCAVSGGWRRSGRSSLRLASSVSRCWSCLRRRSGGRTPKARLHG